MTLRRIALALVLLSLGGACKSKDKQDMEKVKRDVDALSQKAATIIPTPTPPAEEIAGIKAQLISKTVDGASAKKLDAGFKRIEMAAASGTLGSSQVESFRVFARDTWDSDNLVSPADVDAVLAKADSYLPKLPAAQTPKPKKTPTPKKRK